MPLRRELSREDVEFALQRADEMSSRFGGKAVIMVFHETDENADTFTVTRMEIPELVRRMCIWVGCRISEVASQIGWRTARRPDYDA